MSDWVVFWISGYGDCGFEDASANAVIAAADNGPDAIVKAEAATERNSSRASGFYAIPLDDFLTDQRLP